MHTPQNIVVATDLSDCSKAATETAALYAKSFGAKVTMVHAFDPTPYIPPIAIPGPTDLLETAAKEVRKSIQEALAEERDRVFGEQAGHVELTVLRHHAPGVAVVDYAKDHHNDLIIVGSHGRTGLSRVFLGSVAERIVRHAPCAVLVVRPDEAG